MRRIKEKERCFHFKALLRKYQECPNHLHGFLRQQKNNEVQFEYLEHKRHARESLHLTKYLFLGYDLLENHRCSYKILKNISEIYICSYSIFSSPGKSYVFSKVFRNLFKKSRSWKDFVVLL